MRRSRYTEKQIIKMLKEHTAGLSANELCRKCGISAGASLHRRGGGLAIGVSA